MACKIELVPGNTSYRPEIVLRGLLSDRKKIMRAFSEILSPTALKCMILQIGKSFQKSSSNNGHVYKPRMQLLNFLSKCNKNMYVDPLYLWITVVRLSICTNTQFQHGLNVHVLNFTQQRIYFFLKCWRKVLKREKCTIYRHDFTVVLFSRFLLNRPLC